MRVKVKFLRPQAQLPRYHNPDDSGADLHAAEPATIALLAAGILVFVLRHRRV